MPASNIDWAGVAHPKATAPRIASLVPSLTETLFALGLADAVVARTGFCVHPRDAVRSVPKIGGTKAPDLAQLRALRPTHLIVNVDENRREDVDAARAFTPNVVVTHPMGPNDNARLIALIGAVFDRETAAAALIGEVDASLATLDAAVRRLPRERVLYLIWRKPWMSVSRNTYVSKMLARAGLDTIEVASGDRYPRLDDGDSAWRDADRILLSTEPYAFRERDVSALAQATHKPVELIDGEWTSWYGARSAIGARELAAFRLRLAKDA